MSGRDIDGTVRRAVGIAVLRRLRRMVDAEQAQQRDEGRWAVRLAWAFGIAGVIALAWLAFR